MLVTVARDGLLPEVFFLSTALLTNVLFALIAVGAAGFVRGQSTRATLGLVRGRFDVRATAIATLGLVALSIALGWLLEVTGLGERSDTLRDIETTLDAARTSTPWLAVLAVGIAPGIAEELLCRGYILSALRRSTNNAFALVASSAVFALLHFDPVHSSIAFALGFFLGWVTLLARSIVPAVTAHIANNLLIVLAYFFWPVPEIPRALELVISALLFTLALGSIIWLTRTRR